MSCTESPPPRHFKQAFHASSCCAMQIWQSLEWGHQIKDSGELFLVTPNNCKSDTVHDMRRLPLFGTRWTLCEKLTPVNHGSGAAGWNMEPSNSPGKRGQQWRDSQRWLQQTMRRCINHEVGLPPLSSPRPHFFISSKMNEWKSVVERMDGGCLGCREWLEIDQWNGEEGRKPRPWASGQRNKQTKKNLRCFQSPGQSVAGCLHLVLSVQHAWPAKRRFLISYFIQLHNYCTILP